jgi:hypothetical protein
MEDSGLPEKAFDLLTRKSMVILSFTTRDPITFGFERADRIKYGLSRPSPSIINHPSSCHLNTSHRNFSLPRRLKFALPNPPVVNADLLSSSAVLSFSQSRQPSFSYNSWWGRRDTVSKHSISDDPTITVERAIVTSLCSLANPRMRACTIRFIRVIESRIFTEGSEFIDAQTCKRLHVIVYHL